MNPILVSRETYRRASARAVLMLLVIFIVFFVQQKFVLWPLVSVSRSREVTHEADIDI